MFYIVPSFIINILSEITIVVNYDADNGWSTILDYYNKIIELSPELENTIKVLSKLDIPSFSTDELLSIANGMEGVNDNFKNFLKTWDKTGDIAENYQQYLSKATSANSKFAASFKTIAANVGIMLALNVGLKLLAKTWDYINVTVEEQEAKINDLTASYNTLKSEYDELLI